MSLILDALKKSEQERRRERGPDLQSIHRAPLAPVPSTRRGVWMPLLVALLLLNGAALTWWLMRDDGQQATVVLTTPAATSESTLDTATVESSAVPPAPAQEPQPQAAVPQLPPQTLQQPLPEPEFTAVSPMQRSVTVTAPLQQLWELPEGVRRGLPPMTYSFHVYASDPQRRTIIINNRTLREGQQVSDGVLLEEITPDGVILATGGYRVQIPVLGEW